MEYLSKNKFILIAAAALLVIIAMIVWLILVGKKQGTPSAEVLDSNAIMKQIVKSKNLSADKTFYADSNKGTLSFSAQDNSIVLKIPQGITFQTYDREGKIQVESQAADYLGISINQLCAINLVEKDYNNDPLTVDICLGDE